MLRLRLGLISVDGNEINLNDKLVTLCYADRAEESLLSKVNILRNMPCVDGVYKYHILIISPNEVFGDIMVLALAPRPPRRCGHSNSKSIQRISFKFYMRVDTPLSYFAIEI